MKVVKSLVIISLCTSYYFSFSQQVIEDDVVNEIIEEIILDEGSENLIEELTENLYNFYENPININSASEDQLRELFFLSETQIFNLLTYLNEKGELFSIYELQLIEGFDDKTINRLLPFIKIVPFIKKYKTQWKNSILVRTEGTLQKKKGFTNSDNPEANSYLGSPYKQLLKYKSSFSENISAGLVLENDVGECLHWKPKLNYYGMDFLSGHFSLQNKGIVNKLVLGDYQLNVGQGLSLSHSFSIGKTSETVKIRKNSYGLKPYSGSNEYNFFRGVSAVLQWKNIKFTPFLSRKFIDARLEREGTIDNIMASSILNTGFHRTTNELITRQNYTENVLGADLQYTSRNRRFETGLVIHQISFDFPLYPKETTYNQYTFKGKSLLNSGVRLNYNFKNLFVFGELSISENKNFAGLTGIQAIVDPTTTMAFLYRNYSKNYHNFYSQSFAESSFANEEGFYWGLNIDISSQWKVNVYYDLFRFHWLKYQLSNVGSWGSEFLSRIYFLPNRQSTIYFQYKIEAKEKNVDGYQMQTTQYFKKDQYLINFDLDPIHWIQLKSRIQGSTYNSLQGLAIAQDLNFKFSKIKISNRFTIFDSPEYDVRQFIYEKDILYAFSVPSLYGKGIRFYSMLEVKPSKNFTCWLRIAQTNYHDREIIGTGLDEISGSKKTDIKIQLRYIF